MRCRPSVMTISVIGTRLMSVASSRCSVTVRSLASMSEAVQVKPSPLTSRMSMATTGYGMSFWMQEASASIGT